MTDDAPTPAMPRARSTPLDKTVLPPTGLMPCALPSAGDGAA
jgi:hypothetical protein